MEHGEKHLDFYSLKLDEENDQHYIPATVIEGKTPLIESGVSRILVEISCFHGDEDSGRGLLAYDAV
jgi:hypothetical protein